MSDSTTTIGNATSSPSGSLAEMLRAPHESAPRSTSTRTIVLIAIIAALFVAAHWRMFTDYMVMVWAHDENWNHGFAIPLFSLYLLYMRREELAKIQIHWSAWGIPLILIGVAGEVFVLCTIHTAMAQQMAMLVLLFGIVVYLTGLKMARLAWLPVFFLVFSLPWPNMLYQRVSVPLQNFAAGMSAKLLTLFGATVNSSASELNVLDRGGQWSPLAVVEACSGVRSLMAFCALAVAWAYLQNRPIWQRVVLVISAVPIAIACNVLRVSLTATAFIWQQPQFGKDFMHEFTGMLMLIPAVAMLWLLSSLMKALFVEDETDDSAEPNTSGSAAQ